MKVTKDAVKMTGLNAFAIYFILPSLEKKFSALYDKYSTDEFFSDLFSDNGYVDLDALKKSIWWETPYQIPRIRDYY